MDAKKLGKRMRLQELKMDMTQGDLAEATGILRKSISRYETGQALPTLETLELLAKALKKIVWVLFGRIMLSFVIFALVLAHLIIGANDFLQAIFITLHYTGYWAFIMKEFYSLLSPYFLILFAVWIGHQFFSKAVFTTT